MTSVVQMTREAGVALIRVDNPPVNALGHAVRAGLLEAFVAAEQDKQVELIMLYCAGKTFIAGADIREFGQPAQAPILQELTLAIENGAIKGVVDLFCKMHPQHAEAMLATVEAYANGQR